MDNIIVPCFFDSQCILGRCHIVTGHVRVWDNNKARSR